MDVASMILVINLIKEGVGVAVEIKDLAERVANGEKISDEEIKAEREKINAALEDWDKS